MKYYKVSFIIWTEQLKGLSLEEALKTEIKLWKAIAEDHFEIKDLSVKLIK